MLHKLKVWIWCILHLPRIFNLTQTAAIRSAAGEQAIADLRRRLDGEKPGESIEDIIGDFRQVSAGRLDLLEIERKEMVQLIGQFSELQKRELASLKRELLFLQRRTLRPAASAAEGMASTTGAADAIFSGGLSDPADLALCDHLEQLNQEARVGSDDWIRRYRFSGVVTSATPVLHVACGSGWFLKEASKAGLAAYGANPNRLAADALASEGLRIEAREPLPHLISLADGSQGGLLATGLLERLTLPELANFLSEAHRVLAEGAVIVLQCANPENLQVGSRSRIDPARRHLINPQVLSFLVGDRGFVDVEVVRENPISWDKWLDRKDENSVKLNALLYGPQDYCVIARRL